MTVRVTRLETHPEVHRADMRAAHKVKAADGAVADVDAAEVRVEIRAAVKVEAKATVLAPKVRARHDAISSFAFRVNPHRRPA